MLPAFVRPLLQVNPMTPVVQAYQGAMLLQTPIPVSLATVAVMAALLLALALFMFRRASVELVDAL
jgi:lipopolysaccharide transport system permease protein